MVIKKYIAESMSEALIRIRRELGEDAVILRSRKVDKGGLLSFLGKQMVEVTAATPDARPLPQKPMVKLDPQQRKELALATGGKAGKAGSSAPVASRGRSDDASISEVAPSRVTGSETLRNVQDELADLRDSVRELADHMKYKSAPSLPDILSKRWRDMVNNGVNERKAHDMTQTLLAELKGKELENERLIDERLKSMVSGRINTGRILLGSKSGKALVVALIGPTGVGKTTTLAKMATNRQIFGNKKVALVSTDTYRIAAVEQLQTFASIAGLPVEVVYRPEELNRAIEAHAEKDVILIDTAGRSQNDSAALLELREFMEAAQPDEILLVLSAGTRIEDQVDIVKRFGQIPSTRLILTKLDEISSAGHLLDVSELISRQWTYLTIGQNVPDDIIRADPDRIAPWIINKTTFEKSRRSGFK